MAWTLTIKQSYNTIELRFPDSESEDVMILADQIIHHGEEVTVDICKTNVKPKKEESEDK